eukprot:gene9143-10790_t
MPEACKMGRMDEVRFLLLQGADVNAKNKEGSCSIHYAALSGHHKIVRLLLDNGADPFIGDESNRTAIACGKDHVKVKKVLDEHLDPGSSKGWLGGIFGKKHVPDIIAPALTKSVTPTRRVNNPTPVTPTSPNNNNNSSADNTADYGNFGSISNDGSTKSTNSRVSTPTNTKSNITSASASVSDSVFASVAAINLAARANSPSPSPKATSSISTSGVKADELGLQLYHAADNNDSATLRVLLSTPGVNVNWQKQFERTALHWASSQGHGAMVTLLIEKGADQTIKNRHGNTAVENAKDETIKKLFVANISKPTSATSTAAATSKPTATTINSTTNSSNNNNNKNSAKTNNTKAPTTAPATSAAAPAPITHTAEYLATLGQQIWDAANNNNVTLLEELLNRPGANINWMNSNNETALIQACYKGHTEVVSLLIEKKCDLNLREKDGWTALHWASSKGHMDILNLLLSNGADTTIRKINGGLALDSAKDAAVKLMFEQHAAKPNNNSSSSKANTTASTTTATTIDAGKSNNSNNAGTKVSGTASTTANTASTTVTSTAASTATAAATGSTTVYAGPSADELGQQLFNACNSNDATKIGQILQSPNVNINWVNQNGESSLLQACYKGHLQAAQLMIAKGANLNVQEKDGWTALHWAVYKGHIAVLKCLLEAGADTTIKKNNGSTAESIATNQECKNAFIQFAHLQQQQKQQQQVQQQDTTATAKAAPSTPPITKATATTAAAAAAAAAAAPVSPVAVPTTAATTGSVDLGQQLFNAANNNDTAKMTTLLNTPGVNINFINANGESPLLQAAYKGHIKAVQLLVEKKADLEIKEKDGWTALHWAAYKGHVAVLKCLLEAGADTTIKKNNGSTAQDIAINQEVKDTFTAHLSVAKKNTTGTSTTVNTPVNNNVNTATSNTTTSGYNNTSNNDLNNSSSNSTKNYSRPDKTSATKAKDSGKDYAVPPAKSATFDDSLGPLLHEAVSEGQVDIVRTILSKPGINTNHRNEDGETALMEAAGNDYLEIVELLLENGADRNLQDQDGWTALHWASSNGYTKILKLLLQKGANPNLQDQNGETPLDGANDLECRKILLLKGGKTGSEVQNGETAKEESSSTKRTTSGTAATATTATDNVGSPSNSKKEATAPPTSPPVATTTTATAATVSTTVSPTKSTSPPRPLAVPVPIPVRVTTPAVSEPVQETEAQLGKKLHSAADRGEVATVRSLLDKNNTANKHLNINWQNKNKETALLQACYKGHLEIVKLLVENGADMNVQEKDGYTPLHWAAYKGHVEVVDYLLSQGADATLVKKTGTTALQNASNQNIRDIFEKHLNPPSKQLQSATSSTTATTSTTAAKGTENADPVAPVNTSSRQGSPSPLTKEQEVSLCQQLHTAASNNDFATLHTLLTDANNNNCTSVLNHKHQGQETALVQACYANSEECVKLLIEAGADLNTKDSDGWTGLHWAAYNGNSHNVTALLQAGANTSIKSKKGSTALKTCKHAAILEIFATFGVSNNNNNEVQDPAAPKLSGDEWGEALLQAAGDNATIKLNYLLNTCDVDNNIHYVQPMTGENALMRAAGAGHEAVVNILISKGIQVDEQDKTGRTALHYACLHQKEKVLPLLLQAGANPFILDKDGKVAFQLTDNPSMQRIIEEHEGGLQPVGK